jgi:hypothetical protein
MTAQPVRQRPLATHGRTIHWGHKRTTELGPVPGARYSAHQGLMPTLRPACDEQGFSRLRSNFATTVFLGCRLPWQVSSGCVVSFCRGAMFAEIFRCYARSGGFHYELALDRRLPSSFRTRVLSSCQASASTGTVTDLDGGRSKGYGQGAVSCAAEIELVF